MGKGGISEAAPFPCSLSPLLYPPQILGYFDYAFTTIFTVEILLKVPPGHLGSLEGE